MHRALVACCLAVLAVIAGCSSPATTDPRSTTVTPAAVPDPMAGSLAPGLTETGVVDPAALAGAHADVLADRSYTAVYNRTRYFDGRVVWTRDVRAQVDPPGRYRVQRVEDSVYSMPLRESLLVVPGRNRLVVRIDDEPPRTETVAGDPLAAVGVDPARRDRITTLFDLVAVGTVDPRQPGAARYRLSGRTVTDRSELVYDRDRLLNVSFSATVGASGLVRAYTWRYSLVRGRTNVTVVERYRVRAVGETRVNASDDGSSGYSGEVVHPKRRR